jgi:hypothetical protein
MEKEIKEINLPDWFDGEVYTEGSEVTNPYSGHSCYLTAKELSMYDFIKGSEFLLNSGSEDSSLSKMFYDGLWWFKDSSPASYMTLLD